MTFLDQYERRPFTLADTGSLKPAKRARPDYEDGQKGKVPATVVYSHGLLCAKQATGEEAEKEIQNQRSYRERENNSD